MAAECLLANNMDGWITYRPDDNAESLKEWLQTYSPSKVLRQDGIKWLNVSCKTPEDELPQDIDGLHKAWEKITESQTPVTYDSLKQLAIDHNVTSGKWLFDVPTGPSKVDLLWKIVVTNLIQNKMDGLSFTAKVSPYNRGPGKGDHVICIYNKNYTNTEEVYALEKAIIKAGVKCTLRYKPDVYTYCGVYRNRKRNHKHDHKHIIFVSDYDLETRESKIRVCYDDSVFPYSIVNINENC